MRRIASRLTLLVGFWLASAAAQIVVEINKQPPPVGEQLAQHGIGSDKQSLIAALKNRDAEVRLLAALRLGEPDLDAVRGDSIPALGEALRTETDPMAASTMAAVLGGSGISEEPERWKRCAMTRNSAPARNCRSPGSCWI